MWFRGWMTRRSQRSITGDAPRVRTIGTVAKCLANETPFCENAERLRYHAHAQAVNPGRLLLRTVERQRRRIQLILARR